MSEFDDRPPTQTELRDHARMAIAKIGDVLVELALLIGAHAGDGEESSADYARETRAHVCREISRELKEFREMIMIENSSA